MASVIPDLEQLLVTDKITENSGLEDVMGNMFITDNVVSLESSQFLARQNKLLKNKIFHLDKIYKEYILTLHKMIALLKKQGSDTYKTEDMCSNVKAMSIENKAQDLLNEQEFLHQQICNKQQELESKQVVVDNIKKELDSCQGQIQNTLQNKQQDVTRLNLQLDEFKAHLQIFRSENQTLRSENNELKNLLLQKDEKIRILSDTVYNSPQRNSSASSLNARPWIVHHNEVNVSRQVLGTGAWGTVSLGTFRGMTVAVKQLHSLILSQHNQNKFLREMEISSTIRHPHILQFICCSQQDHTLYVVTEVMERSIREAYLSNHISKHQSMRIVLQCALALQYLHEFKPNAIIHRDISSCNVLLSRRGSGWIGKLSDFGAANFLRDNLSTNPGAAIYAAPESFSSVQNTKLDVFSFGVLMIELFTHSLPDPNSRDYQLSRINNSEIRNVITMMLSRSHHERPDMSVVVGSLRIVLNLPSGSLEDCICS